MNELAEKEKIAIKRLQLYAPKDEPYYVAYSGGKDSDVIRILAKLADVPYELHHNLTSVDAPETVQYIKSIEGMHIDKQRYSDGTAKTMWNLIPRKGMPPTKLARYCCAHLKEGGGEGRKVVTGVRWEESVNRKKNAGVIVIRNKDNAKVQGAVSAFETADQFDVTQKGGLISNNDNDEVRRTVEHCYKWCKTTINPIVDWTYRDVWDFLHHYGCESNPLYKSGRTRIGCLCCPMSERKGMLRDAQEYPKYKENYIRAFQRMIDRYDGRPTKNKWETGLDVWRWWVGDDVNQMTFEEYLERIKEEE